VREVRLMGLQHLGLITVYVKMVIHQVIVMEEHVLKLIDVYHHLLHVMLMLIVFIRVLGPIIVHVERVISLGTISVYGLMPVCLTHVMTMRHAAVRVLVSISVLVTMVMLPMGLNVLKLMGVSRIHVMLMQYV